MLDRFIIEFDKGLRALFAPAHARRSVAFRINIPQETGLSTEQQRLSAALMRVNHAGEICAQALYQGQALTARNPEVKASLKKAAEEENEHLAWCTGRIAELGGHTSLLNPLWYLGSFTLGILAGKWGDRWSLGFLAETENQVVRHLDKHLQLIPAADVRSRAIITAMKTEEAQHESNAWQQGAAPLPVVVKKAMQFSSQIMTKTAFWV